MMLSCGLWTGTSVAMGSASEVGLVWTGVAALVNSPGGKVGYLGTISVKGNQSTESVTRVAEVVGTKTV